MFNGQNKFLVSDPTTTVGGTTSVWDGPCLVAFVTPIKQDFILRL